MRSWRSMILCSEQAQISADDEHTIEEDEAHFTEVERIQELAALQAESDIPLEELLKNYTKNKVGREASPISVEDVAEPMRKEKHRISDSLNQTNGSKDVEKSDLDLARTEEYYSPNWMMGNIHSGNGSNHVHHGNNNGDYSCKEDQLTVKIPQSKSNLKDFAMPDVEYLSLADEEPARYVGEPKASVLDTHILQIITSSSDELGSDCYGGSSKKLQQPGSGLEWRFILACGEPLEPCDLLLRMISLRSTIINP